MKKFILILDIAVLLYAGYQLMLTRQQTKILFIGNSYTYENEMPDIFEHLAISKGKPVYVESCTKGKATWLIQSKRSKVFQTIKKKKWDYVILQGYSREMLASPMAMKDTTLPALEKIMRAIEANDSRSKILFFMTWGYKKGYKPVAKANTFEKMCNAVRDGYLKLKDRYHCPVVPVGMAWKDSRYKRPNLELHIDDGAHPNLYGSYLTASAFYAAIFNESAIGSAYYGDIAPELCYYLQSVASRNVLYQSKKYGLNWLKRS